mgnify:FL=1
MAYDPKLEKEDNLFIKKALGRTSFNIKDNEFLIKNQKAIRRLYAQYQFPNLTEDLFVEGLKKDAINKSIKKLKEDGQKDVYKDVFKYRYGKQGPGELILYLLVNNISLAGQAPGDIITERNGTYEVKAVQKPAKGTYANQYTGFFLGAFKVNANPDKVDVDLEKNVPSSLKTALKIKELAVKYKDITRFTDETRTEVGGKIIDIMRSDPRIKAEFAPLEKDFAKLAYQYFKEFPVIFFDNRPNQTTYGEILEICKVPQDRIQIERITQDKMKPAVSCP